MSEDDGTRTRNLRIDSPDDADAILHDFQRSGCAAPPGMHGGCTDPDAARVLAAWPALPAHIRQAIVSLVDAAGRG